MARIVRFGSLLSSSFTHLMQALQNLFNYLRAVLLPSLQSLLISVIP